MHPQRQALEEARSTRPQRPPSSVRFGVCSPRISHHGAQPADAPHSRRARQCVYTDRRAAPVPTPGAPPPLTPPGAACTPADRSAPRPYQPYADPLTNPAQRHPPMTAPVREQDGGARVRPRCSSGSQLVIPRQMRPRPPGSGGGVRSRHATGTTSPPVRHASGSRRRGKTPRKRRQAPQWEVPRHANVWDGPKHPHPLPAWRREREQPHPAQDHCAGRYLGYGNCSCSAAARVSPCGCPVSGLNARKSIVDAHLRIIR